VIHVSLNRPTPLQLIDVANRPFHSNPLREGR
jgi:hypothetical protein